MLKTETKTSSPWAVTLSWLPLAKANTVAPTIWAFWWWLSLWFVITHQSSSVDLSMQNYTSLRAAVIICITLVNTHIHTERDSFWPAIAQPCSCANKKLIRRWDSERELSLRRHRARTTKYNRLVHKFRHRSTLLVGTHVFTKFSEITQYNGHYVVQGHSRSTILVPIESSYTTSY